MNNRFIPKITIFDGIAYQTNQYKKNIYLGDPLNICNILAQQRCQEIIIVCPENLVDYDINAVLGVCRSPVSIGGKFDVPFAEELIGLGAEKIIVSDSLWTMPEKVRLLSSNLGMQAICASVDYIEIDGARMIVMGDYRQHIVCELGEGLRQLEGLEVGELLLSNVSRDGSRTGLDYESIEEIPQFFSNTPVLLGGGYAGSSELNVTSGLDGRVSSTACFLRGKHNAQLTNYPANFSVSSIDKLNNS
jgi:cyclase